MCDREALAYRVVVSVLVVFMLGYVTGCVSNEGGPTTAYDRELQEKKDAIMLKRLEKEACTPAL